MLALRIVLAGAAVIITLTPAFGEQSAPSPHMPLKKTIGQARPEIVASLIVTNAAGATLDGTKLTLKGIAGNAIVFADRPVRAAGHALTAALLDEWNPDYPDRFCADPPNATVSVFGGSEDQIHDAVVQLTNTRIEEADLVFDVAILEGSLTGASGPAAVFIDRIGRPLTPLSFAGVARRTAYRGAFYAGAAGEAAAAASSPYYRPPYCGYPPYPPCY